MLLKKEVGVMKYEINCDFTCIDNVIQMNLLAGTTDNAEAFNVAVGGRNTLNELYGLIKDQLNNQFKITNLSRISRKFKTPGIDWRNYLIT